MRILGGLPVTHQDRGEQIIAPDSVPVGGARLIVAALSLSLSLSRGVHVSVCRRKFLAHVSESGRDVGPSIARHGENQAQEAPPHLAVSLWFLHYSPVQWTVE